MKLEKFKKVEFKLQKEVLINKGKKIEFTEQQYYIYELYSYQSFFIEVIRRKRDKEIIEINPFDDGQKLDFYTKGKKL